MAGKTSFALRWDKLAAAVAYLTEKSRNDAWFGESKLAKLLFYADCAAYLRTAQPITGSNYIHTPNGPYPDDWQGMLGRLEDELEIVVLRGKCPSGRQGHRPVRTAGISIGDLTDAERDFLDEQLRRFAHFNGREIEEYSHDELAWRATVQGQEIPYELLGFRIPGPPDEDIKRRAQRIADSIREHGYRIANDVTPRQ